ncbi:hypothetical protein ELH48_36235 (plasmid) [Rhizobium ruizarguesonis]|uniref:hypothetical protein n=1 Tax=Rhizobium ruizarguesonis TaxID=2081791 RepID=UPI001030F315|nr:hypothetical protein [Rhizobium ruizarguesonis]TBB15011.1 hypothetical protein ELH48_36235 [Rhizobium ruizarguesonis]
MKPPRSNFVVEYKTNRRQTKARPTSIWGNLDLQAVARAVEADEAMHEPALLQAAAVQVNATAIDAGMIDSRAGTEPNRLPNSPPIASPSNEMIKPVAVQNTDFDDGRSHQEQATSAPARARKPSKPRTKTQRLELSRQTAALDRTSVLVVDYASEEGLAALEAENRRLKRLVVAKLRDENKRLESMLRRLAAPESHK